MTPRARQVAAALLLDAVAGEPPAFLHPVVWMGKAISLVERIALTRTSRDIRLLSGIALAAALPSLSFFVAAAVIRTIPRPLRPVLETILLSSTLSVRGLARAAMAVERELEWGDPETARARVREFVGRDTENLSEQEVVRAAVESVAENTSDGVIAPMLYGLAFGAPGALAYKATNTLDSMIGYRDPPYADFGMASALLDDLANLIPARITAILAAAASSLPAAALTSARRYGPLTSSPNAGWAEAAFAGALGVRLGGTNSYGGVVHEGPVLGDGRPPVSQDIRRAVALMRRLCALLAGLMLLREAARRG